MSGGNLTVNRFVGYTASELNTFFDDYVSSFNGVLPSGVAIQNGFAFQNISISDSDAISIGVNTPQDILWAIAYLGENLSDGLTNSTWTVGEMPVDSIGSSSPSFVNQVLDRAAEIESVTSTIANTLITDEDSTPALILESLENTSVKSKTLTQFGTTDRLFQTTESMQQYVANQTIPQNVVHGQVWNTNQFLNGYQMVQRSATQNGLLIRNMYTQSVVQPLSNSAGTTWQQVSFTEEEIDSGLSDNTSLTRITRESFDGIGIDQWSVSATNAVSSLTTITLEKFMNSAGISSGILGWFQEAPIRRMSEGFSSGWPEGTQPTRICSGSGSGSSSEITENITSQINGSTQTFVLTTQYVSGSLRVYWNGQRQIKGETITELSSTTFSTSFVPLVGQYLIVDYVPNTQ